MMVRAVLLFVAFACLLLNGPGLAAQQRLPNIVLIYSDDQGYGDVAALNPDAKFATPNLDRLVREGMTFTDGHCSDTVCTPSRYGLLTGRYSWRSRLKRGVMGAEGPCLIENGRTTLASLLRDRGYRTAMVGKWHLGMKFDGKVGQRDWSLPFTDGPIEKGFEFFFGIPASMNFGILTYLRQDRVTAPAELWTAKKPGQNQGDRLSYRIRPPYEQQREAVKKRQRLEVAADFVDSEVLQRFTAEATQWLAGAVKADEPFFLYLSLTSPHKPVCPQEQFVGKSKAGLYGDFMMETDHRVGQILAALDEHGVADDTIVIFTADNGAENTYRDRLERYGHASSGPFRGGKRDLYEGGHRVPFLVRWPARIKAGSTCRATVCQTDLLATFAEIVGVTLLDDAGEDSFSLLPDLIGGERDKARAPVVHHSAAGYFAVRMGKWKLLVGRGAQGKRKPKAGEAKYELYDLAADPGESTDVFDDHRDVGDRLLERLTKLVQNGRSNVGPKQANHGEWWPQLTWLPKQQER